MSPLALLALWQAASATGALPEDKLAPPLQILEAMTEEWRKGTLQAATGISLQRVVIGFALGASVASSSPWSPGCRRLGENASTRPCRCCGRSRCFGLIPLFIIWFGSARRRRSR